MAANFWKYCFKVKARRCCRNMVAPASQTGLDLNFGKSRRLTIHTMEEANRRRQSTLARHDFPQRQFE